MTSNRLIIRGVSFISAFLLWLNPVQAQELIEESRNALSELVKARQLIAKEKNEWEAEKQIIQDTIETLNRQIEEIEKRLGETEEMTTVDEKKRAELRSRLDELQAITAQYEPVVRGYETRLWDIVPFLPEPLLDKVSRLVDQLPKRGEKASREQLNNRAVIVIGILDEINNFHNAITVHNQLLEVSGQESKEYSVMYMGLSGAYFVDETATVAGIGSPAEDGWVFETVSGIENDVFDAVQIREKKMLARFVSVPTNVKEINP